MGPPCLQQLLLGGLRRWHTSRVDRGIDRAHLGQHCQVSSMLDCFRFLLFLLPMGSRPSNIRGLCQAPSQPSNRGSKQGWMHRCRRRAWGQLGGAWAQRFRHMRTATPQLYSRLGLVQLWERVDVWPRARSHASLVDAACTLLEHMEAPRLCPNDLYTGDTLAR